MNFNDLTEKELQAYIAQNVMLNQALLQTILQNQVEIMAHIQQKPDDLVLSRINNKLSAQIKAVSEATLKTHPHKTRIKEVA